MSLDMYIYVSMLRLCNFLYFVIIIMIFKMYSNLLIVITSVELASALPNYACM